MTKADNLTDLSIEVIDEYLDAARACINTQKPSGGILGFPATLLLLCATDALGHALLKPIPKRHTRLDVLAEPPFSLSLTPTQIDNLRDWYRNRLIHSGQIANDVYLEPDSLGAPFDYDASGALTLIRVGSFYEIIHRVWLQVKPSFNAPVQNSAITRSLPDPSNQSPGFVPSLTPAASGVVKP